MPLDHLEFPGFQLGRMVRLLLVPPLHLFRLLTLLPQCHLVRQGCLGCPRAQWRR